MQLATLVFNLFPLKNESYRSMNPSKTILFHDKGMGGSFTSKESMLTIIICEE
jgi:hypothetical protein